MNALGRANVETVSPMSPIFDNDAFSRLDESNDREFYLRDRFVNHLDSVALSTLEKLIGELIIEEKPTMFVSRGKPRPKDDKYAHYGIPSDPIYAVYAEKKGDGLCRKLRPVVTMDYGEPLNEGELRKRKAVIKDTLLCPYCEEKMQKWAVPNNPFAYTWDNDFMYICFNDSCPYYVRGWDFMYKEGNRGVSYRLMYNPEKDCCAPIPVPTPRALREGIIDD